MEDQVIVWEMPDGTIRYATCAAKAKRPGETKPEWLLRVFQTITRQDFLGAKRILRAVMADGKPLIPGSNDHLIEHRFSGAWLHTGDGKIHIDMPLARTQRMAEIRVKRNALLFDADKMDDQQERNVRLKLPDSLKNVDIYKQALCDLPATVDMERITTPEELAAFEPKWPIMKEP